MRYTDSPTAIHVGKIHLPLEQQAEDGHQHHVQGGKEARLTGVRTGGKTRLLEVGGDGQRRTAADTAQPAARGGSGASAFWWGVGLSLLNALKMAMMTNSTTTAM